MKFFKSLLPTMAMLGLVFSLGACSDKDKNEAASTHYTIDLDGESPVLPEFLKTGDTVTINTEEDGDVTLKLENCEMDGADEASSSKVKVEVSDEKRTFGVDKLVELPKGLWLCEAEMIDGFGIVGAHVKGQMHVEITVSEEDAVEEDAEEAEEAKEEKQEKVAGVQRDPYFHGAFLLQ